MTVEFSSNARKISTWDYAIFILSLRAKGMVSYSLNFVWSSPFNALFVTLSFRLVLRVINLFILLIYFFWIEEVVVPCSDSKYSRSGSGDADYRR